MCLEENLKYISVSDPLFETGCTSVIWTCVHNCGTLSCTGLLRLKTKICKSVLSTYNAPHGQKYWVTCMVMEANAMKLQAYSF